MRDGFRDIEAVLFDLDGMLVDTTELILSCHEHTLEKHLKCAWRPTWRELIRDLGRSLFETVRDYAEADRAASTAEAVEQMLATYRDYGAANHDRLIRPFEGMREALEELRRRRYVLGVVTSKLESTARQALDSYSLGALLPLGVSHEDTDGHKPDPAPLLRAAERAGLDPPRMVYVGDSIHDIAAGRAAGMKTIAALWGPFERAALELEEPDGLVETPLELLKVLPGRRSVGAGS